MMEYHLESVLVKNVAKENQHYKKVKKSGNNVQRVALTDLTGHLSNKTVVGGIIVDSGHDSLADLNRHSIDSHDSLADLNRQSIIDDSIANLNRHSTTDDSINNHSTIDDSINNHTTIDPSTIDHSINNHSNTNSNLDKKTHINKHDESPYVLNSTDYDSDQFNSDHLINELHSDHSNDDITDEEFEDYDEPYLSSEDEPPKPFKLKRNQKMDQELFDIFQMFHSDHLDPDDDDTYEISMVAEYSAEIFEYMHRLELRLRPDPDYMRHQHEIKWYYRAKLLDWLVQIHSLFGLLPETLYLAVNYIDRFLSKRKVSLSRFQLVGLVALFIAAKYEEITCPSLKDIVQMSEYSYSETDIIRAEKFMIDVLEFDMGWPDPMSFLRKISKADDYDLETRTLAKYFLETTIMDYRFVDTLPSILAAGAHFLSRIVLNQGHWSPAHVYYSGYTAEQLAPLAMLILENCRHPRDHHSAIFEKYQQKHYSRVATFVQKWLRAIQDET